MNEDEEVDADDLASQVETDRTRQKIRRDFAKFRWRLQEKVQIYAIKLKNKRPLHLTFFHIYCPCSRKQLTMSWDFFIEENLQEAYWSKYCWLILNFRSHAIKHRERSIERVVNLHVVIEYLKKNADTSRSKQANNHRDLQIILKLLSCRQRH